MTYAYVISRKCYNILNRYLYISINGNNDSKNIHFTTTMNNARNIVNMINNNL